MTQLVLLMFVYNWLHVWHTLGALHVRQFEILQGIHELD